MSESSVSCAISILKNPVEFFDYGVYRQAVMVLKRWMDVLSIWGYPGQFDGFSLTMEGVVNFANVGDLKNGTTLSRLINPFEPYLNGPFSDELRREQWDLIGLSVNYISQLPFALHMSSRIRLLCPEAKICLGGTEITEVVKCAPGSVWTLFDTCDALVVGEGETALLEILDSVRRGHDLPGGRPGILLNGEPIVKQPSIRYEDLSNLPAPKYEFWNWGEYWSPEPVVLYSPTRGCYWNKCTFCDYGLNTDMPTSPSREKPISAAVEELREIGKIAKTIYFAVDAISPRYLRRLSEALVRERLNLRWSAEIRLEKSLTNGLAAVCRAAGCVALSFGYESGSQRVLDQLNKGVRLEEAASALAELAGAGIGAQMMGFIGFPGETDVEAAETFAFLQRHRNEWALAAIGDFVLTPGSIVAKRFASFGIQKLVACDRDDIARVLAWIDAKGEVHIPGDARTSDIERMAESVRFLPDDRPFVGGIDSSHTILYFAHNGRSLVPSLFPTQIRAGLLVQPTVYSTPLPVDEFISRFDVQTLCRQYRRRLMAPTAADLIRWLDEIDTTRAIPRVQKASTLDIYPSGFYSTRVPLKNGGTDNSEQPHSYEKVKDLVLRAAGVL
jgi:hypothetical protein